MYKPLRDRYILIPVAALLVYYLLWLFRAYHDVAYMDEIQVLAGNINNMYNHDATLHDFYYRPPFLLVISTLLVFLNCKLFSYNTFYENITTAIILFFIALYFIKSNVLFFNSRKNRFYFSLLTALIVFCFVKWELSLWGGGFSHYMVVLFGFICVNRAHKYYLDKENNAPGTRSFIFLYTVLSILSILETTSYFLGFQVSLLILLAVNYKLFRDKINLARWKTVLALTLVLIIFSIVINYLAEVYAVSHPYDAYGKVNLSGNLSTSAKKIVSDPVFVAKFFLIANAGNLVDKDSYPPSSFVNNSMPVLGLIVLLFYCYAIFLFIKRKKLEGVFSINLILYTIIFNGMVMAGRLSFNDVYYGASSRYSAATFSGLLGLATFFVMAIYKERNPNVYKRYLFFFPVASIVIGTLIIDRNQWRIAPYRKASFFNMERSFKANQHLENLMGYNNDITAKARQVLIRNKLNVFKPRTKLNEYKVNCAEIDETSAGFYKLENDPFGALRWTNGNGLIILPNLYTTKDTIKVKLVGYPPRSDVPKIILNDNLLPFETNRVDGGYEYRFAFQEQKVLFKLLIQNQSVVPHSLDKSNPDDRELGLIFRSVTLNE